MRIFKGQIVAQMPAEIADKVFRAVSGQEQGRVVGKVVVDFLTVGNRVVAAEIVKEQIKTAGKAFQKFIVVEGKQKFLQSLLRKHRKQEGRCGNRDDGRRPVFAVHQVGGQQNQVAADGGTGHAEENRGPQ